MINVQSVVNKLFSCHCLVLALNTIITSSSICFVVNFLVLFQTDVMVISLFTTPESGILLKDFVSTDSSRNREYFCFLKFWVRNVFSLAACWTPLFISAVYVSLCVALCAFLRNQL